MNATVQFRVLYRHFLFRLMDVEMLSASAGGDASEILGQFGSLLIFGSLALAVGAVTVGQRVREAGAAGAWSTELFLISLNMLVVGIFALLSWDSTFPDRRDVLVLAPLPIHGRTLFAGKVAAVASALALVLAAWNCLSGFAWPLILAPSGSGFIGTIRFVGAFWITLVASGAFLYGALLAVQGATAQLPRRWYLRVSAVLQIALFVLFLGVMCFQSIVAPKNQSWLPTYWFLGLLSETSGAFSAEGHTVMAPLAQRAWIGLAIAILSAGAAFLISYLRVLRKIVEEPDATPGSRGGIWLPRFGNSPQTALAQFVIRTLVRSRQHRAILAFYLGGGFAIVAVYMGAASEITHLTWIEIVRHVSFPMMVATVVMLCAAWLGTRTLFSLPLDLRANWLFRLIPPPEGAASLAAVRRALLSLSVLPIVAVSAALLLWFWPWKPAAEHLLLLALLGSILADASLRGFRKIPFTCSYLPGKSKAHLVFWFGVIPVVIAIHKAAVFEQRTMADPLSYWATAALVATVAVVGRRISNTSAKQHEWETQFEESRSDELIVLGLNR
jgi:hypothetical protein